MNPGPGFSCVGGQPGLRCLSSRGPTARPTPRHHLQPTRHHETMDRDEPSPPFYAEAFGFFLPWLSLSLFLAAEVDHAAAEASSSKNILLRVLILYPFILPLRAVLLVPATVSRLLSLDKTWKPKGDADLPRTTPAQPAEASFEIRQQVTETASVRDSAYFTEDGREADTRESQHPDAAVAHIRNAMAQMEQEMDRLVQANSDLRKTVDGLDYRERELLREIDETRLALEKYKRNFDRLLERDRLHVRAPSGRRSNKPTLFPPQVETLNAQHQELMRLKAMTVSRYYEAGRNY
ncbi:hypothetical protein DFJ74DRAFT_239877 [Hyaloraphidium curvatum]|nr:hypothetical protein DFJ74DRAFT_239877 [Hyaloraphidium curvatum]